MSNKMPESQSNEKQDTKQGLIKIPFFRLGTWKHPQYGQITADRLFISKIISNYKAGVLGRSPFVRLGHDSAIKTTFGDVPAKAWVTEINEENGVLYALAESTTPEIQDLIRTGQYRYASAEYDSNFIDKSTGKNMGPVLMAIALTNEPFLTRLPKAVVLSAPKSTIFLDYEEVKPQENDFTKKLSDFFSSILSGFKPGQNGASSLISRLTDEEQVKLADLEQLKTKLAQAEAKLSWSRSEELKIINLSWQKQIENRLADLVAKGIPPFICNNVKKILLACPSADTTMLKLADNQEISLSEQLFSMLDSIPESSRIKFGQIGSMDSFRPGSPTAKELYHDEYSELSQK